MPLGQTISTPTDILDERTRELNNDFRHLLPRFRHGKISGEVFARERVATIPVDPDVLEEREAEAMKSSGRRKKAENAVPVSEAATVHVGEASEDRPKVDKEVRKQAASEKASSARARKKKVTKKNA